jgi:nucleotide-binding universal stress UspA family protein
MIERIVIPLDGSLTAEAVLPQIRRLLYRHDSEVILVRAVDPPMAENAITAAEAELGAAREYVLGQLERLEKAGVRAKYVVRIGSPVGVILDVVKEHGATMIALATHGATGLKRLLFGSVAEGLLRKSSVPVLLVRPFWSYELVAPVRTERAPVRNLLLAVDGSDLALAALPGVIEIAGLFDARIVLLRVLEEKSAETPAEAEKQLKAIAKTIEKQGIETLSLIQRGEPVDQILKALRFHEIDLLAMATHGRSGLRRAVMGSVSEEVLRRATVPMLIARQGAEAKKPKGLRTVKGAK